MNCFNRRVIVPISRRGFCSGLAAAGAAYLTNSPSTIARAADASTSNSLRVISYNILACTGYPADRPLAQRAVADKQIPRRIALELALYDPHVVTFSESPSEELTQEIAKLLGMNHVRFPSGEEWPGTLLSKFDVIESQNVPLGKKDGVAIAREADLFTRHWGRATLKLPSGNPLIVHSAHLYPFPDPAVRLREIDAMLAAMRGDLDAGRPMLLMGDLNHRPRPPEYSRWQAAGWTDTFAFANKNLPTAEQSEGLTYSASAPKVRIDYIWAAGPLAKQIKSSRPLFQGAFRTNPEDPESFALSDHLPQFAEFAL
jgi:endonuclease/exonuclease/phosphatase family metal-dependent hydrolase